MATLGMRGDERDLRSEAPRSAADKRRPPPRRRTGLMSVCAVLALCSAAGLMELTLGGDVTRGGDELRIVAPILGTDETGPGGADASPRPPRAIVASRAADGPVADGNADAAAGAIESRAPARRIVAVPLPPPRPRPVRMASAPARPRLGSAAGDRRVAAGEHDEALDAEWDASEAPVVLHPGPKGSTAPSTPARSNPLAKSLEVASNAGSFVVATNARLLSGVSDLIEAPFR